MHVSESKIRESHESDKFSNIVSPSKFIVLSILSFGFYELIWIYRNWKFFKEKEKLDISPFWRTVFAIFFIYSLFKKMLAIVMATKCDELLLQ